MATQLPFKEEDPFFFYKWTSFGVKMDKSDLQLQKTLK